MSRHLKEVGRSNGRERRFKVNFLALRHFPSLLVIALWFELFRRGQRDHPGESSGRSCIIE
jgi:hypothetical protein